MRSVIFSLTLFFTTTVVNAYDSDLVEPVRPYEPIQVVGEPYIERNFLGELEGYPEMFELTSDVTFDLSVQLKQKNVEEPGPLNFIIVRDDKKNGGVIEVARLNQNASEWVVEKDPILATEFIKSRLISISAPPGTYRIEVNTPNNFGTYMLTIGDEDIRAGYFKTVGNIWKAQRHFDQPLINFFLTPYVYYPLGIIFLSYLIYLAHIRRNKINHA